MSDLLQRLRSGTFDEYSGDEDLKMEAADEIERLTRLVWADQQNPITWRDMAEHYRKENDRLVKQSVEAIAKDKVAHLEAMLESFKSHRDEQLAEIDRLRAAISGWRDHYGWKDGEYIDNINEIFEPLGGKPDHES